MPPASYAEACKTDGGANGIYFNAAGSSAYLGQTTYWTNSSGVIYHFAMNINSSYNWVRAFGITFRYDYQSVFTHELGHVLGLGHSTNKDATMYPTTGAGETKKRDLHSYDIAGLKALGYAVK